MSGANSATAKEAAEKEAAWLGKLLDEIDDLIGVEGRQVPPHRSGGAQIPDDSPKPSFAQSTEAGKIERHAQIGGTIFHPGIAVQTVIERAYREYEYQRRPENEAKRMERVRSFVQTVGNIDNPDTLTEHESLSSSKPATVAEVLAPLSPEAGKLLGDILTPSSTPTSTETGRTLPVCSEHRSGELEWPDLVTGCAACRIAYLEAQESLLEEWQQRAKKAEETAAEVQRPLDAQMARLNETVTRLNEENEFSTRQLDAIADALGYHRESWRIAGCDVLAHAVQTLLENYARATQTPSSTRGSEPQLGRYPGDKYTLGPYDAISSLTGARYTIIAPGSEPFMASVVAEVPDLETARKIVHALNGRRP